MISAQLSPPFTLGSFWRRPSGSLNAWKSKIARIAKVSRKVKFEQKQNLKKKTYLQLHARPSSPHFGESLKSEVFLEYFPYFYSTAWKIEKKLLTAPTNQYHSQQNENVRKSGKSNFLFYKESFRLNLTSEGKTSDNQVDWHFTSINRHPFSSALYLLSSP